MLHFIYEAPPVPAVRATRNTLWLPRVQKYQDYKNLLAEELALAYPDLVAQGVELKYMKPDKRMKASPRYRLLCNVYTMGDKGDWDNYAKAVCDALEGSGIVWNDKTIYDGHVIKHPHDDTPRVEIQLEVI